MINENHKVGQIAPINLEKEPLKLELLRLEKNDIKFMDQIKVSDIFERGTHNFHPDGLYSTTIFGQIGSKKRTQHFAYIDLKHEVLHALVLECLNDLKKNFYLGIMAGNVYARWDDENKNFVRDSTDGSQTGIAFFLKHWKDIKHESTGSDQRENKILLLERYKEMAEYRYQIVMPAAYRDMEIKDNKRSDNEINDLYRRLLAAANVMIETDDTSVYDIPRWTVQQVARDIFDTIMRILKGKKGALQKKYGRRTTRNGTRNVVTALDSSSHYLDSASNVSLKDTKMSFIQALFGGRPYTLRGLKLSILEEVFPSNLDGDDVWLVNPDTYKRELVTLESDVVDKYATKEGRLKLMSRFFNKDARNEPIKINGYYLGLMYEDETTFKIFQDIDELPDNLDKNKVTPITLGDLLYTAAYPQYQDLWGTMTRYPITGDGSIFPTQYKITTTVTSYSKYQLDDNWEKGELFQEFPNRKKDAIWLNSLSPSLARLERAGADFDGDQFSSPIIYTEDSKNEMKAYYRSRKAYVELNGTFLASAENKSNKLVAFNMTREPLISRYKEEQDLDYFTR